MASSPQTGPLMGQTPFTGPGRPPRSLRRPPSTPLLRKRGIRSPTKPSFAHTPEGSESTRPPLTPLSNRALAPVDEPVRQGPSGSLTRPNKPRDLELATAMSTMSSATPIGDLYSAPVAPYIRGAPSGSSSSRRGSGDDPSPLGPTLALPMRAPNMARGSSEETQGTAETYMTGGSGPDQSGTPSSLQLGLPGVGAQARDPSPAAGAPSMPSNGPEGVPRTSALGHILDAPVNGPRSADEDHRAASPVSPSTFSHSYSPATQSMQARAHTAPTPHRGSGATAANGPRLTTASGRPTNAGLGMGLPSSYDFDANGSTAHASPSTTTGPRSPQQPDDAVQVGFDEGVLRGLCALDCGVPLMLDRLKQALASNREMQSFLRKKAQIEDEYARSMQKLVRERLESYTTLGGEARAGSYVSSWTSMLRVHDVLADNRMRYAGQLVDMAEELGNLGREVDRARKANKDMAGRLEKGLQESEGATEKAKSRFDVAAEELERVIVIKTGENVKDLNNIPHLGSTAGGAGVPGKRTFGKAMSKFKSRNPAQLAKHEEETRSRMGRESDAYRAQVLATQQVRQEYFNLQLPRLLKALKEQSDEIDHGTQFHMLRYALLNENLSVTDGLTVSPVNFEDGPGLRALVEAIDNRDDFRLFMSNYAAHFNQSGQRGPRREGPADEGFLPPMAAQHSQHQQRRPSASSPRPSTNSSHAQLDGARAAASASGASSSTPASTSPAPPSNATFGIDLGEQMARDGLEVPRVLEECAAVVEAHGLDTVGIYRLSGTTSRVQRLKAKLDRDIESVDLTSEENLTDINDISGVLKLWLRELPEPLMTWDLYPGIIEAARIDNPRLRHIRLHERVNELPDPNYAALKFLMGHLDKVRLNEPVNSMSCSNLAVIFGPTLLRPPPGADQGLQLADMSAQCKAVETILDHYKEIFVEEGEAV